MLRLAVIGCGLRATSIVAVMHELESQLQLTAVADPDSAGVRKRLGGAGVGFDTTQFYDNEDQLLEHADSYDGILIGSRCHLHTTLACKVAATRLPLYLEKPVAITGEQLSKLAAAYQGREQDVLISFSLRATPLYTTVLEVVRSGRLGRINQLQAVNNVPYGGVYFGTWYRNYDEVGGLWLQKATHDFDYLTHLLDQRPLRIAATATQMIYGGDKPHELRCSDCDEMATCPESSDNQHRRGDFGGMEWGDAEDGSHDCPYSREIRNQDAGSAIVMYEGGAHASYTQNFVTRRSSRRRGATIIGDLATLEFDWATEKFRIIEHRDDRVDEITVKASGGHGGGDHVQSGYFLDMMRGEPNAGGDLTAGILSAAICLAARESAHSLTFQPILLPGETLDDLPPVTPATEVPV